MATGTATLTATATSAVTLSNPVSLDELQLLGTPTINVDSTVTVEGLMGLEEGKYVIVEPTTTATTNGTRLLAAYVDAKALTGLSATSRATVLLPPGHYTLSADLDMDTAYVDIAGLTGDPAHVFIDGHQVDQRVANCNISNVTIETLQNDAAGAADATCVLTNCIFGTAATQGMQTNDAFTRTFRNCIFYGAGRSADFNTLGGVVDGCKIAGSNTLYLASSTKMYNCVVEPTLNAATGSTSVTVYGCQLKAALGGNLTNTVTTVSPNYQDGNIAI